MINKDKKPKELKAKPEKKIKGEPKPPPMRNMSMLIIMKNIVVACFLFLAALGILAIIIVVTRGDGTQGLRNEIQEMSLSLQKSINTQTEAEAFTQNFVREYFTYENRDIKGYEKRLQQYCPPQLAGEIIEGIMLRETATALYVQAVDTAKYSENQYDITVIADVEFIQKNISMENSLTGNMQEVVTESINKGTLFVVVPIWSDGQGKYIVEDIPRLVAPPSAAVYQRVEYSATTADSTDKAAAHQMLNDFFKTLYMEPQNKIDYYLDENADKSKFAALNLSGIVNFERIDNLALYNQTNPNEFLAIVVIKISDSNGTEYRQRFNVRLVKNDKFYAKDINLRTYNLKP